MLEIFNVKTEKVSLNELPDFKEVRPNVYALLKTDKSDVEDIAGVYAIKCLITNKIYIGESINIRKRWFEHINRQLEKPSIITGEIEKYGIDNFEFTIVKQFEDKEFNDLKIKLLELEEYYLKKFKTKYQLYNQKFDNSAEINSFKKNN